jgi:hypothetical protein
MQNYSNRHVYKGVYSPNEKINPFEERQISAKEYIRDKCPKNMTLEPNLIVIDQKDQKEKTVSRSKSSNFSIA